MPVPLGTYRQHPLWYWSPQRHLQLFRHQRPPRHSHHQRRRQYPLGVRELPALRVRALPVLY